MRAAELFSRETAERISHGFCFLLAAGLLTAAEVRKLADRNRNNYKAQN